MELRHLRYFIAVVEEGSLTLAAERRLHTSQPSLSRQIRDLEQEVGTPLLKRNARGVEPTAAGEAFLTHARMALIQVEAAGEAARRAAQPSKPTFSIGFLTGQEPRWLARITRLLADQMASIELSVSSNYSPQLADDLRRGRLDIAFMRAEADMPELDYRIIAHEPLIVVMPADHPLANGSTVDPAALATCTFISLSGTAPTVRRVIDTYLEAHGLAIVPAHDVDNLAMAMSLITSTGGVALLPEYAQDFLPSSVTSRPLRGEAPTIDLVAAWARSNTSATLKLLLDRLETPST